MIDPGYAIEARVDLVAEETLQGAGTRFTREAGAVLGRPMVVAVRPADLPPEVAAARGAGGWSYTQVLFPFDLEEAAPGLGYVEAVFEVALDDRDVVARQLTAVRYDDPSALGALTTFGDGRGDFRWRIRPQPGASLVEGSRVARVLLEVPRGTTSLTGTIGVSARLADTELGVDVPVTTQEPVPFVLSLPDDTFSAPSPPGPVAREEPVRHGARRMCVTVDVEGYSKRDATEQGRVQAVLVRVLDLALSAAQVAACEYDRQAQGDGHLIVMPPGIDEPRVIRRCLRELASELAEANRHVRPEYAVRVRVALDEDMVYPEVNGFGGDGVVRAHRLRDCAEAKAALAGAPGHHIVIVSEGLYLSSVRTAFSGDPGWRFERTVARVPDKDFSEPCWIHVPVGQGAV
ncbi:hypothetical protein AB0O34_09425 [Sphaerisporangium sp. NPDC088356]|uniref:hypothetical protein n=1 Tax=Sphaerisporangium sp. NPDC088356 TaxID=3154871 RepID=UPI00343E795E